MKRFIIMTLIGIFIALSIISCSDDKTETERAESSLALRNVEVAPVIRDDFVTGIKTAGKIEAETPINITSSLPLKIERIHVREGDRVKAGAVLVELSEHNLKQADLSYRNIEKNFRRMQELLKTDAVDQKSFDDIEAAYKSAESNYNFILENTIIKAPVDGVVSSISFQEGEHNSAMAPYLVRMITTGKMLAITHLSDADYVRTSKGMTATVGVNAYPDQEFQGTVIMISSEADLMAGTFRCEISVNDPQNLLRHNQFANIFIATAESKNTLIIPQAALLNGNRVFIEESGTAKTRTVTTGIHSSTEIEILTGLNEDDQVITVGSIGLTDDYPVNVINR